MRPGQTGLHVERTQKRRSPTSDATASSPSFARVPSRIFTARSKSRSGGPSSSRRWVAEFCPGRRSPPRSNAKRGCSPRSIIPGSSGCLRFRARRGARCGSSSSTSTASLWTRSLRRKGKLSTAGAVAVALAVIGRPRSRARARHRSSRSCSRATSSWRDRGPSSSRTSRRPPTNACRRPPSSSRGARGFGTPGVHVARAAPRRTRRSAERLYFPLGIVLYEMLVGQKPFAAEDDRAASHRGAPRPRCPRRAWFAGRPGALDRVVRRCLAKLPSDRPADRRRARRASSRRSSTSGGFQSSETAFARSSFELGLARAAEDGLVAP